MRNRLMLLGVLAFAPVVASAQGMRGWRETSFVPTPQGEWTGPRLPDGQPDVSGHWSNTIGNHNNLTDPQGPLGADDEAPPQNAGQNARRLKPRNERAPSRVSDPPDGQVPFQPWARAQQQEFLKYLNNPIRPEYVEPFARCAPGGPTKSFMWHGYEIRQYPGYVLFLFDSGNRVIYLDGAGCTFPPISSSGTAIPEGTGRATRWWWIRRTIIPRPGLGAAANSSARTPQLRSASSSILMAIGLRTLPPTPTRPC